MLATHEEETRRPEELRVLRLEADQARTELGPWLEFIEIGDVATTDHLLDEFAIIERINAMFDPLKRLLMVRGIKSISRSTSRDSASSNTKAA
jgi:hypothetical protein